MREKQEKRRALFSEVSKKRRKLKPEDKTFQIRRFYCLAPRKLFLEDPVEVSCGSTITGNPVVSRHETYRSNSDDDGDTTVRRGKRRLKPLDFDSMTVEEIEKHEKRVQISYLSETGQFDLDAEQAQTRLFPFMGDYRLIYRYLSPDHYNPINIEKDSLKSLYVEFYVYHRDTEKGSKYRHCLAMPLEDGSNVNFLIPIATRTYEAAESAFHDFLHTPIPDAAAEALLLYYDFVGDFLRKEECFTKQTFYALDKLANKELVYGRDLLTNVFRMKQQVCQPDAIVSIGELRAMP